MLPIAMLAFALGIALSIAAGFATRARAELLLAAAFEFSVALLLQAQIGPG